MRFSASYPWNKIWMFLIFSLCFPHCLSDPQTFDSRITCGTSNETSQSFVDNVYIVMGTLSEMVSAQGFGKYSVYDPPFTIVGLGECYLGVNKEDCRLCFDTAREELESCIPATSGRIYLDRCFQRFDNYNFYNEGVDDKYDIVTCGWPTGASNDSYMLQDFQSKLDQAIMNVTKIAMKNKGCGRTEVKGGVITVYTLAQCWRTVSAESCSECLKNAGLGLRKCAPGAEGRATFAGCYVRYSTNKIFREKPKPEDDQGKRFFLKKNGFEL